MAILIDAVTFLAATATGLWPYVIAAALGTVAVGLFKRARR